MTPALAIGLLIPPAVFATAEAPDWGTLLRFYGSAAPFVAFMLWLIFRLLRQTDEQRDEHQKLMDAKEKQLEALHAERLRDLQDFAARMTPMLYDAGRAWEQGNERLSKGLSQAEQLRALSDTVNELVQKLEGR